MYRQISQSSHLNHEDQLLQTISKLITELAHHNPNTTIKRLYDGHRKTQQNLSQLRQQHLIKQQASTTPFKVQNTKSLEIIAKNPNKPLYERTPEIISCQEQRRVSAVIGREERQAEGMGRGKRGRLSQRELKRFQDKSEEWEARRREQSNLKRIERLARQEKELRDRPMVRVQTHRILNQNSFYKKDLLNRFGEYQKMSQQQKASKTKCIYEVQTPFTPRLSNKTKLLAAKSFTNLQQGLNVFDRVSRSPSAKCLKHGDYSNKNTSPLNQSQKLNLVLTPDTQIHNITFSTPRSILKSPSQTRGSTARRELGDIRKEEFNRAQVPKGGDGKMQRQKCQPISERDLKNIVYSNKDQVINFVKRLIINERSNH